MTKLLIVRHGNTFDKGDTVLRVGKHTDLPLSTSGKEQAKLLGDYFAINKYKIDKVFTSNLIRTKQTASILLDRLRQDIKITSLDIFDEIDYGPDEGKTEEDVIRRVGTKALSDWDEIAKVPDGWIVDVQKIKSNWQQFANKASKTEELFLVITSNGVARFAPYILQDPELFITQNDIKLSTGSVSLLLHTESGWRVEYWNRKPGNYL
jgi:probable phosphoglycerate mutase